MSEPSSLEARVAKLEHDVETLKQSAHHEPETSQQPNWLDVMAGAFEGDEAFDEVLRLGREFRDAQGIA